MSFHRIGRTGLLALTMLVMLLIPANGFCAGQGSIFETLNEDSPDYECETLYSIQDSDQRFLTAQDLAGLTKDQLWLARNEIFARHGYIFKSDRGKKLVQSLGPCYQARHGDAAKMMKDDFNDYERHNVELIRKFESAK